MDTKIKKTANIIIKPCTDLSAPRYLQVADSITSDILNRRIKTGQQLPSINELSYSSNYSRDTVEKAYKLLRQRNLIHTVKYVGNFVRLEPNQNKKTVFFLINKPGSYKINVYNSFISTLGKKADVTLYFYYYDETLFIDALKKNILNYDYFVIMPHFKNNKENYTSYTPTVIELLETISKEKIIIIDNLHHQISGTLSSIYQDYKIDIQHALKKSIDKLKKYQKLILIFPTKQAFPFPTGIHKGFLIFCKNHQFSFEVLEAIPDNYQFQTKTAYITVEDNSLIQLIQFTKEQNLIMGEDIGLISYNDTPLKSILDISVFSTDFKKMGETAAKIILNKEPKISKNPFYYIERNSL